VIKRAGISAVAVSTALLAAGCSNSAEPEADRTAEPAASTPAPPTVPASPPAPSTTSASIPSASPRIRRGTSVITPRRTLPPAEKLPAFRAVKLTSADYPAGLAAAPDGRILYSELWGGRIRVIRRDGSVDPEPWADVNARYGIRWVEFFHGGLSGIAFDPAFARNGFVYVVTQVPDKRTGFARKSLIVRYKEVNGRGTSPRVLLTLPAQKFDNTYSLVFGPDGMLYIPTGFLGVSRPKGADQLDDLSGKILRLRPNGKSPGDNPFGRRGPFVWATGLKNVFDLAFFPRSRLAIAGENGTSAHDEINLLMPGHEYGYPRRQGITRIPWLTPPLLDYESNNQAPVGIIYYTGRRHPALRGRFLMCNNHGMGMVALQIPRSDPGRLRTLTPIVEECTVDLVQTPDGSIVFSDAGAVYRLEPG
jgi:glucose/arabinose dehydrogenase